MSGQTNQQTTITRNYVVYTPEMEIIQEIELEIYYGDILEILIHNIFNYNGYTYRCVETSII